MCFTPQVKGLRRQSTKTHSQQPTDPKQKTAAFRPVVYYSAEGFSQAEYKIDSNESPSPGTVAGLAEGHWISTRWWKSEARKRWPKAERAGRGAKPRKSGPSNS